MRLVVFFAITGVMACVPQRPDSRVLHGNSTPRQTLTGIKSLSAGTIHTCALDLYGRVQCWGEWQERINDPMQFMPTYVLQDVGVRLHEITQISAESRNTCAVTRGGNVRCWGTGRYGFRSIAKPVYVADGKLLGNITQVSLGSHNVCVLTNNRHVECWDKRKNSPTGVVTTVKKPLDNIVQISVGSEHACASTLDGRVKCWGNGERGQLGNGANELSSLPVDVINADGKPLTGVVRVSAGSSHSCALLGTGHVKCWGAGELGQLGNGDSKDSNRAVDVMIPSGKLANIEQIGTGVIHSCALVNTGHVKCWGSGKEGQMGNGMDGIDAGRKFPVDVTMATGNGIKLLSNIVSIAVGGLHTCGLTADKRVKCWGAGKVGQLGYGTDKDGKSRNRYRAVYVRVHDEE